MVHGRVDITVAGPEDALVLPATAAMPGSVRSAVLQIVNPVPTSGTSNGAVYGPDGTEWAPNTPQDSTNFDVIVSNMTGLNNALAALSTAQVNNGYRIGLADGTDLAAAGTTYIQEHANIKAATQNVLIRAVTPGQAKATNTLNMQGSNLTLAYIDLYSGFGFDTSPYNSWLLRCHGIGTAHINVSSGQSDSTTVPGGGNCGLIGCIYPDNVTAAEDRIHISPKYSGPGHTPGHAMKDFTIDRCWFEGIQLPAGSNFHGDEVQIDGLIGTFSATNSFFGPAPNNGNPQAKADIFLSSDGPFCTCYYKNCTLAGAYVDGQGNASNQSGPHRGYNNVYYDVSSSMAFRYNDSHYSSAGSDCVLDGCTFYGDISYYSTSGITVTNATYYSASLKQNAVPTLKKPWWAWW